MGVNQFSNLNHLTSVTGKSLGPLGGNKPEKKKKKNIYIYSQ